MTAAPATPLLALLLILAGGCAEDPAGPPEPHPDGLSVLFVGNSLTAANDLPGMVRALVEEAGLPRPRIASLTAGNFAIEDHWAGGAVQGLITDGEWDYVVIQQGPSSLPESRTNLVYWTERLNTLAAPAGTRLALYMVWPDETRLFAFDDVRESYRAAAQAVDGVFLPAGEAWRSAWAERPDAPLYDADRFHPTVAGTYAAALVIVEGLWGVPPEGLPARFDVPGGRVALEEELAALLQRAAAGANARWLRR